MTLPPVYWGLLVAHDSEPDEASLSPAEKKHLESLHFAKRRAEWMLGRYAAKRLLAACLAELKFVSLNHITIANDPQGAPFVTLDDIRQPGCLSISHRSGMAFCAFAQDIQVGADIELVEPKSPVFVEDFFTSMEQQQLQQTPLTSRDLVTCAVWSAKEAVLKTYKKGLRLDTRAIDISLEWEAVAGWRRFKFASPLPGSENCVGWWQEHVLHGDKWVLTLCTSRTASLVQVSLS
ncbi:MAG TPA: 4'-phosphopantetheinyl transferase superfamily protein [Anaerolineaceae bacterium]